MKTHICFLSIQFNAYLDTNLIHVPSNETISYFYFVYDCVFYGFWTRRNYYICVCKTHILVSFCIKKPTNKLTLTTRIFQWVCEIQSVYIYFTCFLRPRRVTNHWFKRKNDRFQNIIVRDSSRPPCPRQKIIAYLRLHLTSSLNTRPARKHATHSGQMHSPPVCNACKTIFRLRHGHFAVCMSFCLHKRPCCFFSPPFVNTHTSTA